jgi:ABC-type uncharacterized transport system permease subunit
MWLTLITTISYLTSGLLEARNLFRKNPVPNGLIIALSLMALIGHGWLLYTWIETTQGQNLDPWIMFSLTTWLMGLILFGSLPKPGLALVAFVHPISALSIAGTFYFAGESIVMTKTNPGILIHIALSLLASSVLYLAAFQSALCNIQNYLLKQHKQWPMLNLLPPLQTMERVLFNIIGLGNVLLLATLLSGLSFVSEPARQGLLPKMLLSFAAWLLFVGLWSGRLLFGWRGPTTFRWTFIGVFLLFGAYFGTQFIQT